MKKLLSLIVMILVAFTFLGNVFAAQSTDYQQVQPVVVVDLSNGQTALSADPFTMKVEVEGVENPNLVNINRGDKLNVRVELLGGNTLAKDVRVKAWINGYEFGDIEDETSIFDVKPNVTYVKNLVLNIPNDISASKKYNLHIEASNDQDTTNRIIPIQVEAKRHSLNFVDVIFNPGLNVRNTQPLFVTVRLENLGDKKEEDIRVEASIPELGISQRTFINELVTHENDDIDSNKQTSESSDTLLLDLSNVQPGTYTLRVKADYNRGHDSIVQAYLLTVTGAQVSTGGVQDAMVQAAKSSMDISSGGSAIYTFSVANLGDKIRTFNFEVTGQEFWANAQAEPMSVTVLPGSTKDVLVTVNARSDADAGNKIFTVRVKEGSNVVKELQLNANVKAEQPIVDNVSSLKSGLEIGFVVLLVILVILGIILAVNKLKGKEEGGESYY